MNAELLRTEVSYNPQTGEFTRLKARGGNPIGSRVGNRAKTGYMEACILGHRDTLHRFAWLYMTGEWPTHGIDHRDRDRSNNRWANLRDVPQSVNNRNTGLRKDNTSGTKGVYWSKAHALWTARIFDGGHTVSLGYFRDKQQAIEARAAAFSRTFPAEVAA